MGISQKAVQKENLVSVKLLYSPPEEIQVGSVGARRRYTACEAMGEELHIRTNTHTYAHTHTHTNNTHKHTHTNTHVRTHTYTPKHA